MVLLVGPAPPVWGSVFHRGMVRLPLGSSNVIVTCLVPSPPVGWGLWSFWPRLCRAVFFTEVWYGCCRLLAVMSSLRAVTIQNMRLLFSPCKRGACPCSDAVGSPLSTGWDPSPCCPRSGCAGPLPAGACRRPGSGARGGGGWIPLANCSALLLCLASSPPPLWSGVCGLVGCPHPACVGQCVLQRYGTVAAC